MSEFVGGTLVLGSFAVFLVSLFALFKPLKTLKLGNRKRAALGIGLSFVMIIVGAMFLPKPTPEQQAALDAAAAQRAANEKSGQETAERAAAATAAEGLERDKVALTTAVKGMWTDVTTQLSSCDQAGEYVAETAGRRNPNVYEIYPMVQQAETLCREAAYNVSQIRVPNSVPRQFRRAFDDAFDTCRNAYYTKSSAYSSMGKVLNGDARPSAVTEARSAAEASQASGLRCAVGFMKAATDAGVPVGDFMDEPAAD